jgi:wyosine [tRNA(Phe)-imidazoG37] synthetase (radical SAM superfamily)
VEQVVAAVEAVLTRPAVTPAFLTFSGNGEPTTHPDFLSAVEGVVAVRARLLPTAQVAVLSNSTRVFEPRVRRALALLDQRIMKLDAGTEEVFRRYCRPLEPVTLDEIVGGLGSLGDVTLQALFTGGPGGNAEPAHVEAWVARVAAIRPGDVQIYTVDRPWPARDLVPLDGDALDDIARAVRDVGISVSVSANVQLRAG